MPQLGRILPRVSRIARSRDRAAVLLGALGGAAPELRGSVERLVRKAWSRTTTVAGAARALGVSRGTMHRIRDAHPHLFA